MRRSREEVRVQPQDEEVRDVSLQRLRGEQEQLPAPQTLHQEVHETQQG